MTTVGSQEMNSRSDVERCKACFRPETPLARDLLIQSAMKSEHLGETEEVNGSL